MAKTRTTTGRDHAHRDRTPTARRVGRAGTRPRRPWRCAARSCLLCADPDADRQGDRRQGRLQPGNGVEVAETVRRATSRRADRRTATRAARTIGDDVVEQVVIDTLETTPKDATHWSTRSMAATHGISHQTVSEIWRAFGLKPWEIDEFKISPDPQLVEKIRDIVGLYMNPPVNAAVFAVDEKPQIQALNRTAPMLPMMPTTSQRRSHDYQRNGTIDLFAALDIATGQGDLRAAPEPHLSAVHQVLEQDQPRSPRRARRPRRAWTTCRPTRRQPCTSGCCATAGSTSTSPRPTGHG